MLLANVLFLNYTYTNYVQNSPLGVELLLLNVVVSVECCLIVLWS
jgi:hypothetical protein